MSRVRKQSARIPCKTCVVLSLLGVAGAIALASADTLIDSTEPKATVRQIMPIDDRENTGGGGAAAADGVDFSRRFYFGAGAGLSRIEPISRSDALSVGDESDSGFQIFGGYDLNRWLSAEVYFADLGAAEIDFLGSPISEIDYQVYGINAVAYLLNSRSGFGLSSDPKQGLWKREGLSLYAKAGIGGLSNDSTVNFDQDYKVHVTFGAGVEYGFSNGLALRADLTSFDSDAQYASLSILKRFGTVAESSTLARQPETVVTESASAADPTPIQPQPRAEPELVLTNQFAFDGTAITSDTRAALDAIVREERDSDSILIIDGHTDWTGSEDYNQGLSERRAEAVFEYLVELGFDASRLRVQGYGEDRPISSNDSAAGRADNRRTEVYKR